MIELLDESNRDSVEIDALSLLNVSWKIPVSVWKISPLLVGACRPSSDLARTVKVERVHL